MRQFSLLLVLLLATAPAALGQAPGDRSPLAENAALQYWQAFSQLPPHDESHDKVYSDLYTISLQDPTAKKMLDASRTSMMYLRRARALSKCDWGLDYNDGISMLMPHLGKSRDLARFAALDARRSFEHGNYKAGRNTVHAIMVLGRHVSRDPVMISLVVGIGIEGMAIDATAPYLPEWKPSYSESKQMLERLPPAPRFEESLVLERKFLGESIVRQLREEAKRSPTGWRDLWNNLFMGTEVPIPAVASVEEAIRLVEQILPVYDELARFMKMPQAQFDAEYPAFKQRTKAEQPLAGLLLPAIDQVRIKQQRHEARLAMLLAATAVIESGPAKLAEIKDPFGTGPFEYRTLDKGFELKSKAQYEGQPVTLTIGQRR